MKRILIDVGSSTTKAYLQSGNLLTPLIQKSIYFKEGFDQEDGIAEKNKKELFELVSSIRKQNKNIEIKIYATGIFRKLCLEARTNFIDEFFSRTGLFFNIITQDLENFYLEMALVGRYLLSDPVLLINIGGGSTELVVMCGKEAVERKNIDLGVGTILAQFPTINNSTSKVELKEVIGFVEKALPSLSNKTKIAFYSGGELTYMSLANYNLENNKLFKDKDHPSIISTLNFAKRNKEILKDVKLKELESLMPENPKWMHGARGCSAIAQAICEKYQIKTIIPSDSNIINGVIRQEFRHVTISGSFRKHLDYISRKNE